MNALTLLLALSAFAHAAPAPYGILLLAHGGDESWNAEIARLRARVDAKIPTETALGMADLKSLQSAADRLAGRGVGRIVAVPLFVHSRSEVLDQTRYALGLREKPSEALRAAYAGMAGAHAAHGEGKDPHAGHGSKRAGGHGHSMVFSTERVKSSAPIVMAPALDDDALVADVLLERARGLSKTPARETVVLVAHGPNDETAVAAWQEALDRLAGSVKTRGKFRAAAGAMLRDDTAPPVRAAAVARLRALVEKGAAAGRVLVVPVLIARGGIEKKIGADLAGLDYAWDGKTLMPHPGFDEWVLRRAKGAVETRVQ